MTIAVEPRPETPAAAPALRGGLFPACITTFAADESLDVGAFRAVLDYQWRGLVDGVVVAGTTGEAHALTEDERAALFRAAVEVSAGRGPVLAGAGATTARQARRYVALAADAGCDAALVLTPWFEHADDDVLLRYYAAVVDQSPLPVLLYHNPSRTHQTWRPEAIARVANELGERVVGIKDSMCDIGRVRALRERVSSGFRIFSGVPYDWQAFAAAGADGCIDGYLNPIPREGGEAMRGDADRVQYLREVHACFNKSRNYIALQKRVMDALGLPAGKPRAPFDGVDEQEFVALRQVMRARGRLVAGDAGRPTEQLATDDARRVKLWQAPEVMPVPEEGRLTTVPVYTARAGDYLYSHHPAIAHHDGKFWAAWSNARFNEDIAGQVVRFATSDDGLAWSAPQAVMPEPVDYLRWTCAGFWTTGGEFYLLATRYTRARYVDGEFRSDGCWENLATDAYRWTGSAWAPAGAILEDVYINEAPRPLGDGSYLLTGVNGDHDVVMIRGGREGIADWTKTITSRRAMGLKVTEPSWYRHADGRLCVLLRDDGGSRWLWYIESADDGRTWSEPAPTDIPDGQSKFFACHRHEGGRGPVALVSNSTGGPLRRRMLNVSFINEAGIFDRHLTLRHDPDASARHPGMHKARGFQYPNALWKDGALWIINSINKEDIEVHRLRLDP